jgi:hypothetical protein
LLHVRRRDWAHHLSEEIVRAFFWFHPAIAWLIARVRLAREQVVDLEVVKLTNARKPYLEALLAFTNARASFSAVPAPPFLAESQLAERVALMLKEGGMSRTRLVASLTSIVCFLALTVALAVWAFPLKAASRNAHNAPQSGVAGGVSGGAGGGISGGVSSGAGGGVSGGVASGIGGSASGDIPTVDLSTVWTDTVKRGPMIRQVRGLGTLAKSDSGNLVAKITLPEFMAKEIQPNQDLTLATPNWTVKGHVRGLAREISNGAASLDLGLEDIALPQGAGAGLQIDATIDIEKLDNILQIGRPVAAAANSTSSVFRIVKDGTEAVRVNVRFGRPSVSVIEILDGLKEGDKIILSDMSTYNNADRVYITDEKHPSKP